MDQLIEGLQRHLGKFQTAPFLFVGSGVSRRYIGSDSWEDLLRRFSGFTGNPYEYYKSTAKGSMDSIASLIAADFHELWWKDDSFSESRLQNKMHAKSPSSALKIEISNYLSSLKFNNTEKHPYWEELELFKKMTIDGIITTNYDCLLEECFPDFKVFIGQEELLFSSQQHVAEIYKIHGCITDPNSLIITSEDYADYNKRNAYLAAKLITIFIEHPIVFIGYSIQDPNIHQLLQSICGCISTENVDKLRDRLIFVERCKAGAKPGIEDSSIMIQEGVALPVVRIKTDSMSPVFEAMTMIGRKFPAKLLRLLKEHVYELVATTDPQNKLYVKNIEGADEDFSNCDMVFGVGAIAAVNGIGYKGLTRRDLVIDVLTGGTKLNSKTVIELSMDEIFYNRTKYCPIYKYLRDSSLLTDSGQLIDGCEVSDKVRQHVRKFPSEAFYTDTSLTRVIRLQEKYRTFGELVASMRPEDVLRHIPGLKPDFLSIEELGEFLNSNIEFLDHDAHSSNFCRAASIYDYRKYIKPITNITVMRIN